MTQPYRYHVNYLKVRINQHLRNAEYNIITREAATLLIQQELDKLTKLEAVEPPTLFGTTIHGKRYHDYNFQL